MSTDPQVAKHRRERLSVVIPCRNEEAYIESCVRSVLEADPAGTELTVVVCDGQSDDRTREVVAHLSAGHPNVLLVDNPERTTPHALNRGLQAVPFDWGMILGAHAEIGHEYLRLCIDALRNDPALGCVGGLLHNEYGNDASRAIGFAMGHPFGVGNAHFRTGRKSGLVDTVAFGIYRRSVFDRVGWFDPKLARNQDDEFSFRLTRAGIGIWFIPEASALYHVRASFGKLFRQYHQYGYWKVYVNRKHRAVTTLRQMVPALWVLFLFAGALLTCVPGVPAFPWLAGVCIYVAASLAAARSAGARGAVFAVARAFWTLHLGYGTGYLKGMWDFIVLRRDPSGTGPSLTR